MNKLNKVLSAAALLLAVSTVIAPGAALAEKLLQGQVCEENVHKLTSDIDWLHSLKKAEKAAQEQNKLIFWLHMVGKIDGST